jgi:hypothetical protein
VEQQSHLNLIPKTIRFTGKLFYILIILKKYDDKELRLNNLKLKSNNNNNNLTRIFALFYYHQYQLPFKYPPPLPSSASCAGWFVPPAQAQSTNLNPSDNRNGHSDEDGSSHEEYLVAKKKIDAAGSEHEIIMRHVSCVVAAHCNVIVVCVQKMSW